VRRAFSGPASGVKFVGQDVVKLPPVFTAWPSVINEQVVPQSN